MKGERILKNSNIKKYKVKNDIIFSYIFSHKDILKSFLENVIDEKIESIEVENQFKLDRNNFNEKMCVLDIKAVINKDTFIDVEMQNSVHHSYLKRVYLYFGGITKSQVRKGMDYSKLKDAIIINILNENMFKDINKYHTVWRLYEDDNKEHKPLDSLQVHFIELEKFRMSNPDLSIKLNQWLAFIDTENEKWVKSVMEENDKIKEAYRLKEQFTLDDETEELLYKYEIWKMDQKELIKEAREEGLKEGEEKNQVKIVKAMLKKNIGIETISEITGLSKEEIEKIK